MDSPLSLATASRTGSVCRTGSTTPRTLSYEIKPHRLQPCLHPDGSRCRFGYDTARRLLYGTALQNLPGCTSQCVLQPYHNTATAGTSSSVPATNLTKQLCTGVPETPPERPWMMTGRCWSSAGTATCSTAWGPSMPPGSASFTAAGQPLLLLRPTQALSCRSAILGLMAACWGTHCVLLFVVSWQIMMHGLMQAMSTSQWI